VHHFIDKNNDTAPDGVEAFFAASSNILLPEILKLKQETPASGVAAAATAKSNRRNSHTKVVRTTVASVFNRQMDELVTTLDATRVGFIRCIKVCDFCPIAYLFLFIFIFILFYRLLSLTSVLFLSDNIDFQSV
jgi:hypothetical protein